MRIPVPDPLPRILVDQSLGCNAMPAFFRNAGFETSTVAELFGRSDVPGVDWIRRAAALDMVVAHKDSKIRYRAAEKQAVVDSGLRMLCLTSGNLKTAEQVQCFHTNLDAIKRLFATRGPWIVAVRRSGIAKLPLD
jgi:predicted nuclease of predicted toxin-antitoxin system